MLVVLKEGKNFYLTQPLSTFSHVKMSYNDVIAGENVPIWKVVGNKNTIVMGDNNPLFNDILRYHPEVFHGRITEEKLIKLIIPKIRKLCEEYNIFEKSTNFPSCFVVAQKNKAFLIGEDGFVWNIENFEAVGWYNAVIKGSLILNENLPARQRIKRAFKDSFFLVGWKERAVACMNTNDEQLQILNLD